jgi:hypothetical protein
MHEIKITWEGPFEFEEVITKLTDEGEPPDYDGDDYGLYQIYGEHILCGKNTLVYIGKAVEQTFSSRFLQHRKLWLENELNTQVYIGRIYDPEKHSKKEDWNGWKQDVDFAEKILIYKYSPNYNSSDIANPPEHIFDEYDKIRLVHDGEKGGLESEDNAPENF